MACRAKPAFQFGDAGGLEGKLLAQHRNLRLLARNDFNRRRRAACVSCSDGCDWESGCGDVRSLTHARSPASSPLPLVQRF